MRVLWDVLRLSAESDLSVRGIGRALGISHSTVLGYLRRAKAAGVHWPLPEGMPEAKLKALLYGPPEVAKETRPLPDWSEVERKMQVKGFTRRLMWERYRRDHSDGYGYSKFCALYSAWKKEFGQVTVPMDHPAGHSAFVDYAGMRLEAIDQLTRKRRRVEIFVGVLGFSNYLYVEATWTQRLGDWLGSHRRMFEAFGAVPSYVVCDNLKSGVRKAHRYDPEINPSYQDLAMHYKTVVVPTRPGKPRDKAKVEQAVLHAERRILAPLSDKRFIGLAHVNRHIRVHLKELNERPFQKLEGSRKSWFDTWERSAMKPLPAEPYEHAEWRKAKVHRDAHIEVRWHRYSVPYRYVGRSVQVRLTDTTLEVLFDDKRVATHPRSHQKGVTTKDEHMPDAQRQMNDMSRFVTEAERIGPDTHNIVRQIIDAERHPLIRYRTLMGLLRLARIYGKSRMENACTRAIAIGTRSYRSIASILKNGLDKHPLDSESPPPIDHDNIRGPSYYDTKSDSPHQTSKA